MKQPTLSTELSEVIDRLPVTDEMKNAIKMMVKYEAMYYANDCIINMLKKEQTKEVIHPKQLEIP
jgi:hypothetical protein